MANLRRLSWVDIMLIILLVVGAALTFSFSQTKTNTEQEKVGLETRARATELSLNEADKKATLESLRQTLEQLRLAPAAKRLPGETDAIAVTNEILQHAKKNDIIITRWDSSYTSTTLNEKTYPAISHHLMTEGKADGLIGFIKALTQASTAPVVQGIDITGVEGQENRWQMNLELMVYYT